MTSRLRDTAISDAPQSAGAWIPLAGASKRILFSRFFVERVHFDLAHANPNEIGMKCASIVFSHCGALGAKPRGLLWAVGAPQGTHSIFLGELARGIEQVSGRHRVRAVRGEIASSPTCWTLQMVIDAELIKGAPFRSQPRAGDSIGITGSLGVAAAGNQVIQKLGRGARHVDGALLASYLNPPGRLGEALALIRSGLVTSLSDNKEGLSVELAGLFTDRGLGAEVDEKALPSEGSLMGLCDLIQGNPLLFKLHGSEDYELILTVSPSKRTQVERLLAGKKCRLSWIGKVTKGSSLEIIRANGERAELLSRSWHPFVRRLPAAV